MAKLKLSLENLAVESFDVKKPAADVRGTVHGQNNTRYETWEAYSCEYIETCAHWRTCYMDCTMDCSFRWC